MPGKPAAPVQPQQASKKKTKFVFSKTLTRDSKTESAVSNNSIVNDTTITPAVKVMTENSSMKGAKKRKQKRRKTGNKADDVAVTSTTSKLETNDGDIDDLFSSLKTKKLNKSIAEEQLKLAEEEEEGHQKRLQRQIKKLEAQNTNSTAVGLNPDPRPVRYDEDNLPIYTETALQIGKGGNTKDCPFDCWCCF